MTAVTVDGGVHFSGLASWIRVKLGQKVEWDRCDSCASWGISFRVEMSGLLPDRFELAHRCRDERSEQGCSIAFEKMRSVE